MSVYAGSVVFTKYLYLNSCIAIKEIYEIHSYTYYLLFIIVLCILFVLLFLQYEGYLNVMECIKIPLLNLLVPNFRQHLSSAFLF